MVDAVIEVENLEVSYGRTTVIHGASFKIGQGESVGLIGETGSGKSTLARAVVGLVPATAGTIRVAGEELTAFGGRQWREFRMRGAIQYVFQDPLRALDPEISIGDSLAEPLRLQRRLSKEQIRDRIAFRVDQVRLTTDLLERLPGELSGGQRQRVLLARALVTEPRALILDEPVSALDAANRVSVLEILNDLREAGTSLMFISHDLGSVAGVTDRVMVLYRGELVESGPTASIVSDPQHPYSRLLVGSAPSLHSGAIPREERAELRRLLDAS